MRALSISVCILTAWAGIIGLASPATAGEAVQEAIALIYPVKGQKVTGELHFTPTQEGLKITGSFSDLEPGMHGFHVHRYGNCTSPNEGSVGPHFSPIGEGAVRKSNRHRAGST